jgi:hypothetical protein
LQTTLKEHDTASQPPSAHGTVNNRYDQHAYAGGMLGGAVLDARFLSRMKM